MNPKEFNLRRYLITFISILLAIAAYVIGYRMTQIDPIKLLTSLPKSKKIIGDLIHPDVTTRKTQDTTLDLVFPVPCGSAETFCNLRPVDRGSPPMCLAPIQEI